MWCGLRTGSSIRKLPAFVIQAIETQLPHEAPRGCLKKGSLTWPALFSKSPSVSVSTKFSS